MPAKTEKINEKQPITIIFNHFAHQQGVNINFINIIFLAIMSVFYKFCSKWINSAHLLINNELLTLSKKGMLMADYISSDLFLGGLSIFDKYEGTIEHKDTHFKSI